MLAYDVPRVLGSSAVTNPQLRRRLRQAASSGAELNKHAAALLRPVRGGRLRPIFRQRQPVRLPKL